MIAQRRVDNSSFERCHGPGILAGALRSALEYRRATLVIWSFQLVEIGAEDRLRA
jgi:hypothetical protein